MRIIFFSHPTYLRHQSMIRFVELLQKGMIERGHQVEVWLPKARFFAFPAPSPLKKWLGYIDQFGIFPFEVRRRLKSCGSDTLFVFTDQALGPWVSLVGNRPHVIHCHDFLAQQSAIGEIPENTTSWTGRQYQYIIREGFNLGKYFISVSHKTREQLHDFLTSPPILSEVIYNALNPIFKPSDPSIVRHRLGNSINVNLSSGYLLHVGGNQWYKNREGVIDIYDAWRSKSQIDLPLLLIGESPSYKILIAYSNSPFKHDIHFLTGMSDDFVHLAYAGATVFLFPSLSEGFGWPIAEAMACGCPVITTNEAPMTEVAGNAANLIPRRPFDVLNVKDWANKASNIVSKVVALPDSERSEVVKAGLENASRFNVDFTLDKVERLYKDILERNFKNESVKRAVPCRESNMGFGI